MSEELKGKVLPNILYDVELKNMRNYNGYVVVSAVPVRFKAKVETVTVIKSIYQVVIIFGNKTIYYDPKEGKSPSSKTLEGVLNLINSRVDIVDSQQVIEELKEQTIALHKKMENDGLFLSN